MPERGRCFSMGSATLSVPVAVDHDRLEAAARNSVGKKGEQKDVKHLYARGTAELGKVASLCYAGPLAGRKKNRISGNRYRPKPIPWGKKS